nr:blue copper protein-like [Ipomoea batatas]
MANKLSMALVIAMVAAATMLHGSSAQTTHVVGDTTGWTIPANGAASTYSTWASRNTFTVGDILVFRFTTGAHDVTEVSRAGFDGCNATNPISQNTNGPANITLRTAGQHYYICSIPSHCGIGQKLAINVSAAASTAPAPQPSAASPAPVPSQAPASTPAATPSPSPSPSGGAAAQTYTVGDSLGWTVPTTAGSNPYQTWVRNKDFKVGDTLVFNFPTGAHNVAEVSKSAFDSCSGSSPISTESTGPARIALATPGQHFYICTFPGHCSGGMKLAVNVTGTAFPPSSGPAPTTPPSSSTDTPPSVPSADSPPPPSTAAPSIAIAALPLTFLSVALAFLY